MSKKISTKLSKKLSKKPSKKINLRIFVVNQQKKIKNVLENQIKKNLILKKEDFQKRLV